MAASPIVDLPAPDSPIRPRTSPRRSVRSTPLTISVHFSSLWPSMRRPRISSSTSPFLPRGLGDDPAFFTVSTTVIGLLLLEAARLVQEPVDDEVDGDRQQRDGARRQQRRGIAEADEGGVVLHHRAPVGRRRLNTEAEEGQGADGQEDEAEAQTEFGHERWQNVRQDLARHDPQQPLALQLGGLDGIENRDVRGHRARQAEYAG